MSGNKLHVGVSKKLNNLSNVAGGGCYGCNSTYEMSTNLTEVRNGVRGTAHVNVKCVDFYAIHKCGN